MLYYETATNYTDLKIMLTVHTDASDKNLGAVIGKINKITAFFQGY